MPWATISIAQTSTKPRTSPPVLAHERLTQSVSPRGQQVFGSAAFNCPRSVAIYLSAPLTDPQPSE